MEHKHLAKYSSLSTTKHSARTNILRFVVLSLQGCFLFFFFYNNYYLNIYQSTQYIPSLGVMGFNCTSDTNYNASYKYHNIECNYKW